MKRRTLLLLLTAALAFAVPARADQFLLGFTGYDYEDPSNVGAPGDGSPPAYLNLGEGYRMIGFVESFGPMLQPYTDNSVFEYTIDMYGLIVIARAYTPPNLEVVCAPGRVRYFQDSRSGGTPATYGVNPPNATAPSTFDDGSLLLGGAVTGFDLTYDYSINQGDFSGNANLDEGSALIYIDPSVRNGWILGGLSGHELTGFPLNPNVPPGYNHQVNGECRRPDPTPAHSATWGAIKSLYR